jgi:hypothetical protein
MGVESIPGFDALTDHDKVELVKFEHYLRVKREPEQPIEGAYAHVYGEVVYAECLHSFGTTAARAEPHCVKCGEPYVNPTSGLWDEEEK